MIVSVEKKKVLTQAFVHIELESEEEVQAFENVLTLSERWIYDRTRGNDFKLEKQIIYSLRKNLS